MEAFESIPPIYDFVLNIPISEEKETKKELQDFLRKMNIQHSFKQMPGKAIKLNIPIVSLEHFKQDKEEKILVIVLAWNFATEIIKKINQVKGNKDVVIIESYFPTIKYYTP
jgi:BioD-like phosphotransacetylase family protein